MNLPDSHAHFDQECEREKARKQSEHDPNSAKKFRPSGKVCHPAGNAERSHHVHVMMKAAPYFGITVRDHDRSKDQSKHEQCEGLHSVEKIHIYLRESERVRKTYQLEYALPSLPIWFDPL